MEITILPGSKKLPIEKDTNLLDALAKADFLLDTSCGGRGTCGKCKVRMLSRKVPEPDEAEKRALSRSELESGFRLACRQQVREDLVIGLQETAHSQRKKDMITFPEGFRADRLSDGKGAASCGVSVDVGTTTVVAVLWDLDRGMSLAAEAQTNPQSHFGADVISRIQYGEKSPENLNTLHEKITGLVDELIGKAALGCEIDREQIREITVVGNTVMSHFFLGLDPSSMARVPFTPAFTGSVSRSAKSLGITACGEALVHVLPNIAGHVGSDLTAVMIATRLKDLTGANLVIDIGTNGEILLAKDGRVLTCSAAAGPAFEGASISCGMRASEGAIEGMRIEGERVCLDVIGGGKALGLCGSGLIDAVAQLLDAGILDGTGRMVEIEEGRKLEIPEELLKRLVTGERGYGFLLAEGESTGGEPVILTQLDVREVQMAKGAIAAGIALLMRDMELEAKDLESVMVAGAFGNFIRKESAVRIGLIPRVSPDRIKAVGNAAATGAAMALLSKDRREACEGLVKEVEHVELSEHPDFQNVFLDEMYFPEGM